MIITGIGSRQTPDPILAQMTRLGQYADRHGWWVRSGHADGADYAFELGARGRCIAYLPWAGFNSARPIVAGKTGVPPLTPGRRSLVKLLRGHDDTEGVTLLMNRNLSQVMGMNLDKPSDVVVCWTPGGELIGGTAFAVQYAQAHSIPVINMFQHPTMESVIAALQALNFVTP